MTTTSVMKITTLDARHAPHRAPPMHQPVDQPLIEPPSAHLLDHGREPGEECRRVGIIKSRSTSITPQQPAAQRRIEVREVAHRRVRHRVQPRGDPLIDSPQTIKPATVAGIMISERKDGFTATATGG
jgi:hypothetical protein